MNRKQNETPEDQPNEAPKSHAGALSKFLFLALFIGGLLALFYGEEDWRGKKAWLRVLEDLAARQENMEWKRVLATPPPDELNAMKAPGIGPEFIKGGTVTPGSPIRAPGFSNKANNKTRATEEVEPREVKLGEIEIVATGSSKAGNFIRFETLPSNPDAQEAVLRAFVGRCANTPDGLYCLTEKAPSDARVTLVAEVIPKAEAIQAALAQTNSPMVRSALIYREAAPGKFTVWRESRGWKTAEAFLKMPNEDFDHLLAVHEAVKRPQCWIPGDYQTPFAVPILNFVRIRTLAQYAGSRAQACVLLRRNADAIEELGYIWDLRKLLDTRPRTLVSTMINVAVTGLGVSIVEQGFAADVWGPNDLRKIEATMASIELVEPVMDSLRSGERVGVCHLMETISMPELKKLFGGVSKETRLQGMLYDLIPRGWIYQNMANYASTMQIALDSVDLHKMRISPHLLSETTEMIESHASSSPMWMLAAACTPNVEKAIKTAAKNQTLANQARVAAALELYRREHNSYPESLNALVDKYLPNVPRDLILPQPLRYQRVGQSYVLYSPGWDSRDSVKPALGNLGNVELGLWLLYNQALKDDWIWKGLPTARQTRSLASTIKP